MTRQHWEDRYHTGLTPWDTRITPPEVVQFWQDPAVPPNALALDLGCGTGTLAGMLSSTGADVIGVDGDRHILRLAQAKARAAGASTRFHQAYAQRLPYADGTFDAVVSSLVFHHLDRDGKQLAAAEAFRVLRDGGQLTVLDFGPPDGLWPWLVSLGLRHLEQTADNLDGRLPQFLAASGFVGVAEDGRARTILGTMRYLVAKRPA